MAYENRQLCEGFCRNDAGVFRYLVQQVRPVVVNYVRTHGGNDEEGDILFTDAFMKAREKICHGGPYAEKAQNGEVKLEGLIVNIAKLMWLETLRKRGKNPAQPGNDPGTILGNTPEEDLQQPDWMEDEVIALLYDCLEKLPPEQRAVVEQLYLFESSYELIAASLNIEQATARKRKERALTNLRNCISARMDDV